VAFAIMPKPSQFAILPTFSQSLGDGTMSSGRLYRKGRIWASSMNWRCLRLQNWGRRGKPSALLFFGVLLRKSVVAEIQCVGRCRRRLERSVLAMTMVNKMNGPAITKAAIGFAPTGAENSTKRVKRPEPMTEPLATFSQVHAYRLLPRGLFWCGRWLVIGSAASVMFVHCLLANPLR
jgi:hypothetical protein